MEKSDVREQSLDESPCQGIAACGFCEDYREKAMSCLGGKKKGPLDSCASFNCMWHGRK